LIQSFRDDGVIECLDILGMGSMGVVEAMVEVADNLEAGTAKDGR
jgi:hypothetical protein